MARNEAGTMPSRSTLGMPMCLWAVKTHQVNVLALEREGFNTKANQGSPGWLDIA